MMGRLPDAEGCIHPTQVAALPTSQWFAALKVKHPPFATGGRIEGKSDPDLIRRLAPHPCVIDARR